MYFLMENTQQELMMAVGLCKLEALDLLIDDFAHKNRAKMVQKLLELKHQLEEKLGLNKSLQAQYGQQNPPTYDKLLGVSNITNHDKGGLNKNGSFMPNLS